MHELAASTADVRVKHLTSLTKVESRDFQCTKVTSVGIDDLKKRLPKCKNELDGGDLAEVEIGLSTHDSRRRAASDACFLGRSSTFY